MPDVGATAGRRLVDVLTDAHVKTRARLAPLEAQIRSAATGAQLEMWETELAEVNKVLLRSMFPNSEIGEALEAHIDSLTSPTHQVDFLIGVGAAVMSVFSIAGAVVAGGIDEITAQSREKEPHIPLSPEALAKAVVNNVMTREKGEKEARKSGVEEHNFEYLVEITGMPLPIMQLMEAYRRNIIDQDRLHRGLLQGDTRNEWFDVMLAMRYAPPGAAAAIQGAVQGFLTEGQSRDKAQEAGLDPDDWQWMYDLAGNPPGGETMLELLNRGDMTLEQVRAGLRESNLKNKYIEPFIKSRRRLMQQEQIRMSINHGSMTDSEALHRFLQLGFDRADAEAFVALAHSMKTAVNKDLARTQVVAGYEERFFDRAKASSMLTGLGYDFDEAAFMLDLADHQREKRFLSAAVSRFHSLYVRRRVSRDAASMALDRLGVPPDSRDDLLRLWDYEREADTPDLSVAQWQGLLRRGVIDDARFTAEMTHRGYTDEEASLLIPLAYPPSAFGPS